MEGNQLKEVLARFGHEDFREGQREPIEAVLRGESGCRNGTQGLEDVRRIRQSDR